jgi:hypothetical protein
MLNGIDGRNSFGFKNGLHDPYVEGSGTALLHDP